MYNFYQVQRAIINLSKDGTVPSKIKEDKFQCVRVSEDLEDAQKKLNETLSCECPIYSKKIKENECIIYRIQNLIINDKIEGDLKKRNLLEIKFKKENLINYANRLETI